MKDKQYTDMLMSLMQRYAEVERELGSLADAIRALTALSPESLAENGGSIGSLPTPPARVFPPPRHIPTVSGPSTASGPGKYSAISMRWSCLWMLAESAPNGLGTSEITERLRAGGKSSTAYNFLSTVSAVLSNMKSRGEADLNEGSWSLTTLGLKSWSAIRPKLAQAGLLDFEEAKPTVSA
jgi:hypothetical protein